MHLLIQQVSEEQLSCARQWGSADKDPIFCSCKCAQNNKLANKRITDPDLLAEDGTLNECI